MNNRSHNIIEVEEVSKKYRLGVIGTTTVKDTVERISDKLRRRRGAAVTDAFSARHRDREFWALRDVSFQVERGEVLGIVGKNGAGKSTLLKILSRITTPTAGRVRVRGQVASLLEVGTGFHPDLTGHENIYLNGAILGMKRAEITRLFDEIVEFSGVGKFIDTPVKRYSSGMYVRLAFGVAAHLQPEILIVDEVLAVGDAEFQKKCLGKMGDVSKQGRTVIFVSHNMNAMQSLCTRAIWLDDGKVRAQGETRQIIADYLHAPQALNTVRVWNDPQTAPGSAEVRLRGVRLELPPDVDEELPAVDMSYDVTLDYEVLQPDLQLRFGFNVFNRENTLIFATPNTDDSEWHGKRHPAGVYRSSCRIPAFLLNSGSYSLELVFMCDTKVCLALPDALTFEVRDLPTERGAWFGKWPGIVRPRLHWTTRLQPAEAACTAPERDAAERADESLLVTY